MIHSSSILYKHIDYPVPCNQGRVYRVERRLLCCIGRPAAKSLDCIWISLLRAFVNEWTLRLRGSERHRLPDLDVHARIVVKIWVGVRQLYVRIPGFREYLSRLNRLFSLVVHVQIEWVRSFFSTNENYAYQSEQTFPSTRFCGVAGASTLTICRAYTSG